LGEAWWCVASGVLAAAGVGGEDGSALVSGVGSAGSAELERVPVVVEDAGLEVAVAHDPCGHVGGDGVAAVFKVGGAGAGGGVLGEFLVAGGDHEGGGVAADAGCVAVLDGVGDESDDRVGLSLCCGPLIEHAAPVQRRGGQVIGAAAAAAAAVAAGKPA